MEQKVQNQPTRKSFSQVFCKSQTDKKICIPLGIFCGLGPHAANRAVQGKGTSNADSSFGPRPRPLAPKHRERNIKVSSLQKDKHSMKVKRHTPLDPGLAAVTQRNLKRRHIRQRRKKSWKSWKPVGIAKMATTSTYGWSFSFSIHSCLNVGQQAKTMTGRCVKCKSEVVGKSNGCNALVSVHIVV
jgi:hypothetical protein